MSLIGFIIPSSNPTMERLLNRTALLEVLGIDAVCTRVRVVAIGEDSASDDQFGTDVMASAADLLADCEPDLIVWAGTSGFWLGPAADDAIVAAVGARTGIDATTTRRAQLAALRDVGGRHIGVYTPNPGAVHRKVIDALTVEGFEVVRDHAAGICRNLDFAKIPAAELERQVAHLSGVEQLPVAVVCTNICTSTGNAVDSAIATVWWAARMTGATDVDYRTAHQAAGDD